MQWPLCYALQSQSLPRWKPVLASITELPLWKNVILAPVTDWLRKSALRKQTYVHLCLSACLIWGGISQALLDEPQFKSVMKNTQPQNKALPPKKQQPKKPQPK